MKGIIIWAHDNCRSTLGFYIDLLKRFGVPSKINIVHPVGMSKRELVGFKADELTDNKIHYIDGNEKEAINDLMAHWDWNHLFTSYQKKDIFKSLIDCAISNNITYAIMSEAPCNMEARPIRRTLKHFYINQVLRYKLSRIINYSDFILNYSGYYENALKRIGWTDEKIISCGYFPPPIPQSHLQKRTTDNWQNFSILLSGIHKWHRDPMVLLKALSILKKEGIRPKCYITQDGPLLEKMKEYATNQGLSNIEFLGFVAMDTLIHLYETCSVYVGAGQAEPWGMRLNDVLQCGAPLIVSRGMGGVKLVDDYCCGLSFDRGDAAGLADAIKKMIIDKDSYLTYAENAYNAALAVAPAKKAVEMSKAIQHKFASKWS